jgi:mannosyltransferase OCH1-like enzyme
VGTEVNIPKKLGQIWVGPRPAPLQWMHTWRDKHPEWNYTIFTDEMLRSRKWHNGHLIEHYYNTGKFPGVSDLIRYELLYEHGGFWPEADMTCLENTDELFTSPENYAYSCYENEKLPTPNIQPIMACNPENVFVKHVIDTLHKLKPTDLKPEPFRSTGNLFLSQHHPNFKHMITIWPSHYFIPLFYIRGAKRYDGPDKVYADHKWGSTGHANSITYDKGI